MPLAPCAAQFHRGFPVLEHSDTLVVVPARRLTGHANRVTFRAIMRSDNLGACLHGIRNLPRELWADRPAPD